MDDRLRSVHRWRDVAFRRAHAHRHLELVRVSPSDDGLDKIVAINDVGKLQNSNHSRCPGNILQVENYRAPSRAEAGVTRAAPPDSRLLRFLTRTEAAQALFVAGKEKYADDKP